MHSNFVSISNKVPQRTLFYIRPKTEVVTKTYSINVMLVRLGEYNCKPI